MAAPELKMYRKQVVDRVASTIDHLFVSAGYVRNGLMWEKAGKSFGFSRKSEPQRPGGFLNKLFPGMLGRVVNELTSAVPLNDGAAYIALQRDKYHGGFFINTGVRNVGPYDKDASISSDNRGYKLFRGQCYLRDLPRNYQNDMYYYVRLAEDAAYFDFMMSMIVGRIFPFLERYATNDTPLPMVAEFIKGRELKLPQIERRRFYEIQPTQHMYEQMVAQADHFGFGLRDGRWFYGVVKEIGDGKLHLSWRRTELQTADTKLPPDQWVTFSEIDHGSLSYRDAETQHYVPFELPESA
jgi:hypothetical protein